MPENEEQRKLADDFINAALKLTRADNLALDDRSLWADVDKDTLIDTLRVQSALLKNANVELDGWIEAMRLISDLAKTATHDPSGYNEVCALLSPRVGTGKELSMLTMILLTLDGWRKQNGRQS